VSSLEIVNQHMRYLITEWKEKDILQKDDTIVIGCSTSEVIGKEIGTSSTKDVANIIFEQISELAKASDTHLAFQCCEHLNRALVVERKTLIQKRLTEVSVIPTPEAGGAMAAKAYEKFNDAVVVETIQAEAGLDIGQTLIGMHLRPVVVPVRFRQNKIHHALITGATTRPKLIGGRRASYE